MTLKPDRAGRSAYRTAGARGDQRDRRPAWKARRADRTPGILARVSFQGILAVCALAVAAPLWASLFYDFFRDRD